MAGTHLENEDGLGEELLKVRTVLDKRTFLKTISSQFVYKEMTFFIHHIVDVKAVMRLRLQTTGYV